MGKCGIILAKHGRGKITFLRGEGQYLGPCLAMQARAQQKVFLKKLTD
jgi:hypothetical protein